jgi:hypothetical protein
LDAAKATDWTATLMLLVEVHILTLSAATDGGTKQGRLDLSALVSLDSKDL